MRKESSLALDVLPCHNDSRPQLKVETLKDKQCGEHKEVVDYIESEYDDLQIAHINKNQNNEN